MADKMKRLVRRKSDGEYFPFNDEFPCAENFPDDPAKPHIKNPRRKPDFEVVEVPERMVVMGNKLIDPKDYDKEVEKAKAAGAIGIVNPPEEDPNEDPLDEMGYRELQDFAKQREFDIGLGGSIEELRERVKAARDDAKAALAEVTD